MPDVYLTINEADPVLLAEIADGLELRAALPQQVEILETYLGDIEFPEDARVLDVGCGTGAQSRTLIERPQVAEVVGVDRARFLLVSELAEAAGKETDEIEGKIDIALTESLKDIKSKVEH